MQTWSTGLFLPFDWAVALTEEADLTVRTAREVRAIDQEYLDVLLTPPQDLPVPVIPLKTRERADQKMPEPARPEDHPDGMRRCA
jgi:hypothetical protein